MSTAQQLESPSLDELVRQSIRNAIHTDAIKEKVQAAADKAIASAIDSAFGYGSDFRKGVEAAVRQVLPIVDADDMATFTHATREVLQRRLATLADETAAKHLQEVFQRLLPDDPVINMRDLKKAFIEKIERDSDDGCYCHDESPTYTWESESRDMDGYWDFWCSPEEDACRYSGKAIVLRFQSDEATGLSQCWYASVDGKQVPVGSLFQGPLYGFDAMVFRLATGVAKLRR